MKQRAWVQAAIDVENYEDARKIASIALDNGAEWLEVGTPLLFKYGYDSITKIRKYVGKNTVLIADYKYPVGFLFAKHAKDAGADYILISDVYKDFLVSKTVDVCKGLDLGVVVDFEVKAQDYGQRLVELEKLGVEYVFAHHYDFYKNQTGAFSKYDTLDALISQNTSVKIGITSDDYEEAQDAVRKGADWITFGVALKKMDSDICRDWINMIHNAR